MTRILTLDKIVLEHKFWKNPRTITAMSQKELLEVGEDILDRGQITPYIVQQVKGDDGDVIELALDGQRRTLGLMAACRARKKAFSSVEIKVDDLTGAPNPIELTQESSDRMMLDILAAGIKRAGLGSYEQCEAAMVLRNRNPEMTMADIGAAIGRSESWVSRMVRARKLAGAQLLKAWASGKITDEQFKDLADIAPAVNDSGNVAHDEQNDALGQVLGTREGGREAKAEARNKLKEKAAKAKAEKKAAKPVSKKAKAKAEKKAKNGHAKPMTEVFNKAKPMLAEITALRDKKKPSDPYVKGLMDGALYAMGQASPEDFAPAWRTYLKAVQKIEDRQAAN